MSTYSYEINVKTNGEVDIIDITSQIQNIVKKSNIKNGIACVFVPGSTGTITTIEYEPGLKKDFPRALQKIAPKGDHYDHHETWHDDNGHSHVRASLMGPSINIPIIDNMLKIPRMIPMIANTMAIDLAHPLSDSNPNPTMKYRIPKTISTAAIA